MVRGKIQASGAETMEKSQQTKQTDQDNPEQTKRTKQTESAKRQAVRRRNGIFAALCCSLLLFTLVGMLAHLRATYAHQANVTPTVTQFVTSTDTPTDTPTPSPTPTPTPSPTPSPTPTTAPTATPTTAPTATPTQPRPTPTRQSGPTPTSTVGNQVYPTATPAPNTTPTAAASPTPTGTGSSLSTATPIATAITPGNSTDQSSTSPDNSSTGNKTSDSITPMLVLGSLAAGLLLLVVVAIFLVRKLLNPVPAQASLPPSGARPWSRTPSPSMDGATNLYGWENPATDEQAWANDPFAKPTPAPAFAAPFPQQPQQTADMWIPQNPAMAVGNGWNSIPATDAGQPTWDAGNTGNPAFANQSPFYPAPESSGFPVTPGTLPTTGTQWGISAGNISTPFYAQGNPPFAPSNASFPTMQPSPAIGGQPPVANPATYDKQLPFPGMPFDGS